MPFLRKPLLLHYYVTTACNCRCQFCNIPNLEPKTASIGNVIDNLRAARRIGAKFVDFTGGEPLLFSDLPNALVEAKRLGFITSVTTNGILLKERIRELRGVIDLPRISIDGNAVVHDSVRGVAAFERAMLGLEAAYSEKMAFDIIFTLTEQNKNEIDFVYGTAIKFGAILILDPSFSYFGNSDARELDYLLRKWSRKRGVYVNTAFLELRARGGNLSEKPVCKAGDAVIVVSADNRLLLPCFHGVQAGYEINGELENLWNSQKIKAERALSGKLGVCEGCTINCYMDPSFMYQFNSLCFRSLLAKAKYAYEKWIL